MDIDECFEKGLIKKTRIDSNLIKSLIEMSDLKEKAIRKIVLDTENISVYASLAYDSLREALEALCISKGYKVTSHVCLGLLLKDALGRAKYDLFDRLRFIRNNINYYGTKIGLKQGKIIIRKTLEMKNSIIKENLKEFYP
ncbi:hypothetical protein JW756_03290 [Candidatus Woesearchaeota archaeon]|nr:hypothetical protein [Candidatus Woesearchaeota archaeon]